MIYEAVSTGSRQTVHQLFGWSVLYRGQVDFERDTRLVVDAGGNPLDAATAGQTPVVVS